MNCVSHRACWNYFFGVVPRRTLPRPFLADLIIPPSLREIHRRGLALFNATGEAAVLGKRIEVSAMRRDGTEFPAELAITRINQEGPAFFTGQLRDLTEQKRVQTEMLRS